MATTRLDSTAISAPEHARLDAVLRKRKPSPSSSADPDLVVLREADAEYHRLCIDVQEPTVAREELRLDEMAAAVERLARAIARLQDGDR